MRKPCFMIALLMAAIASSADVTDGLKFKLDFTSVVGQNVTDNISGITAKVMNTATVEEMGDYYVLNLGN